MADLPYFALAKPNRCSVCAGKDGFDRGLAHWRSATFFHCCLWSRYAVPPLFIATIESFLLRCASV